MKSSKDIEATSPKKKSKTPKPVEVALSRPKGRPMLSWVGKRALTRVKTLPSQRTEVFAPSSERAALLGKVGHWAKWPGEYPKGGLLFHGDNSEVLAHLLTSGFRGSVDLIYIDPPFDSGADYVRKVSLRGPKGNAKIEGQDYSLGEQIQYTDIWAHDNYLQFMFERLLLLKELLSTTGSIFLHCDYRKVHHLRQLMDEVFGEDAFVNEIIWMAEGGGTSGLRFGRKHQTILFYSKAEKESDRTFNVDAVRVPYKTKNIRPQKYHFESNQKRRPGFKDGYVWTPNEAGKIPTDVWLDAFLAESEGVPLDVWNDVKGLYGPSGEIEQYPTQKPVALLERIVKACSNPGDLVLDCFVGSGTTVAVAQKLGRRWIGCDINKQAVQTTAKRIQGIIAEQLKVKAEKPSGDASLGGPAQVSYGVWRVNNYDLAIQHNEAVNLACEAIGVQRTRTDVFFDGVLGKSLVKIIPFGHPISPIDLEDVRRELEARPDEDRSVTLVSLGTEVLAKAWVEDWNRLRKGKDAINRIDLIDLRTDPVHGGFIRHDPAKARVSIERVKNQIVVKVADFISPTILERLQRQSSLVKPRIEDFRSMIDCVMIDTDYDGTVFNVSLSDVPSSASSIIKGEYTLPAPTGSATIAVKLVDMLGEEVLEVKKV